MIQFQLPPDPQIRPVTAPADGSLQHLLDFTAARTDLSATTRKSYCGAIDKAGEVFNQPLSAVPAGLGALELAFPPDGFDPLHWPTNAAYSLCRRRLLGAARHFHGVHARKSELRAIVDGWDELLARAEPLTKAKVGRAAWHPMKLKSLRTFVLVARAHGVEPRRFTLPVAQEIDAAYRGNKRTANRKAIGYLDELRQFPELLAHLPPTPVGFAPAPGQAGRAPLPAHWEEQIGRGVDAVTRAGWDPVTESFTDEHNKHAHVLTSALRTALRIARELGMASPETLDAFAVLAEPDIISAVAGEMFARKARARKEGRLKERTTRKYLKGIRQVLQGAGATCQTDTLSLIIKNNKDSRKGGEAEKEMTQENRRFCEMLVARPDLQRRFFYSFQTLRDLAEEMLAEIAAEGRTPTPREASRIRLLGVATCFAAIEIGGAPIRVSNAMALTYRGKDAWFRVPKSRRKPIEVQIPAAFTKNKKEIRFPIKPSKHGFQDTIRWYLDNIRPLFPHADESPYLFPAVTVPDAHFDPGWFGEAFADFMRLHVDLPMTPHRMRHGQTSLLLNAHPTEVEVIAKRIDDTPATLRRFYGWLDSMRLVERGQDLLVGLM